ncbi:4-diphosphocytidyl-2C-methyl-D-erythritol kinase [Microbacterium sp. Leaf347]|uniref:4-(cytidine 5'-diphospho)-2-C-methyl-D-erythritol kinase n=1 Tax=Microbacterium TaxID=33882 RepID=UPI0006F95170|nr:4-diphosphocytidyl-2C-methyl-D-erythritol kinase [Microbacterium sp. Leaf351]KQR96998.1 4-diphosphocytidyl-2C-methyl-D-erythritol kinase [Microbacterium sp. Leaf347]OJU78734.1 MAG: 4-(cytidine 5'-diphospho)-2-C-methyl-D-erythritol kinase [Microbacterium sp. 71-23]
MEAVILPAPTVHVRAPGKINLFFEVGALGADGYHDVASAYQAVSAYEDVWASASDDLTIEVTGSVDVAGVPLDARNLAVRAAQLVADEAGIDAGVHLRIVKDVPVAGGMGGGSADAAAALVACDALWGTGISPIRLRELAAELGADVPFALSGGTAIGLGRGDDLSPALARGRFDWVIVTSEDGLSTPAVFAALDAHRDDASLDIVPARRPMVDDAVLHALRAGDAHMLAASLRNDLQQAALALRPDLADLLETGRAAGALEGIVSGSGPTVAFLAAGPEAAIDLQIGLSAAGHVAHHVHGPVPGARVIHDD